MKLLIKIREVAEANGVKNAYQLQKKANLAPTTAARLFSNEISQITIDALEKLCAAFKCDAGKFFVREKTPRRKRREPETK
jgi:DNA-binding Xre family transcriptional regulator